MTIASDQIALQAETRETLLKLIIDAAGHSANKTGEKVKHLAEAYSLVVGAEGPVR
jgi:hypothetical protein